MATTWPESLQGMLPDPPETQLSARKIPHICVMLFHKRWLIYVVSFELHNAIRKHNYPVYKFNRPRRNAPLCATSPREPCRMGCKPRSLSWNPGFSPCGGYLWKRHSLLPLFSFFPLPSFLSSFFFSIMMHLFKLFASLSLNLSKNNNE